MERLAAVSGGIYAIAVSIVHNQIEKWGGGRCDCIDCPSPYFKKFCTNTDVQLYTIQERCFRCRYDLF